MDLVEAITNALRARDLHVSNRDIAYLASFHGWDTYIGVASEFADVLIRLLDECYRHDVDLEAEYERKMAYNRTRAYRHGGRTL